MVGVDGVAFKRIKVEHLAVIAVVAVVMMVPHRLPGTDYTRGARLPRKSGEATTTLDESRNASEIQTLVLQKPSKLCGGLDAWIVNRNAGNVKLVKGASHFVGGHVMQLVAEHGEAIFAKIDEIDTKSLQVGQEPGPGFLLVVFGVPGSPHGVEKVNDLRPRVASEAATGVSLLVHA